METEYQPRSRPSRLAKPSLWVVENTDSAISIMEKSDAPSPSPRGDELSPRVDDPSDDVHPLLEENALLRRILVKLDLVLKKVAPELD